MVDIQPLRDLYVPMEAGEIPLPPHLMTVPQMLAQGNKIRRGEELDMWTCIGLDPGGTTGWCVIRIHLIAMQSPEYRILENIVNWSAGEVNGPINHQLDRLIDLLDAWPDAEVVCEDFILRQMSGGRSLLDPIRITQPLEWWLQSGGRRAWDTEEGEDWKPRELHLQQPALAMSTITDERLKAFGVLSLTAGKPHARDSLRHALTFARRRKQEMNLASGILTPVGKLDKDGRVS